MRRPWFSVLTVVLSATAACGTAAPRAVAEPKKVDDTPLVRASLDNDADIARAIREHYTKYEYRVPMRDGARLFTVAYVPKDSSRPFPIVLTRTPYAVAPYGVDNYPTSQNARLLRRFAPSAAMIRDGYVFVHQDVRGRMMSEGSFVDIRPHATTPKGIDESTDAFDTIDWLVKNVPNNNGRVGVWGISYPGFYAAQAAVNAHPALRAVSPQAPVTEWFAGDDFHHNGAFFLADAFDFYGTFGKARPSPTKKALPWTNEHEGMDVYDFFLGLGPIANADARYMKGEIAFWKDLFDHGTRDDFWKARDPRPWYKVGGAGAQAARPAVMTVGGWFDSEDLFGALATYRAFEEQSPKNVENVLVMGPWSHGGWARNDGDRLGDVTFGAKTSLFYREQIELAFFQRHLKGKSGAAPPEAWIFETGTNVWQRHETWPPKNGRPTTLYFHAGSMLDGRAPGAKDDEAGADHYVSDPQKPVPYRGRHSSGIDPDYMTEDQRFAARRPDVLVYTTPVLDADVSVCGPIDASLWVTTTGTDADFVVKVIDVYPQDIADPDPPLAGVKLGGYQQLVRAEIMRGKFRTSLEKPEPFKPGEPTLVKLSLPDTCHAFRTGHRLMVQVQSSWFPLADRNPQTFTDIYRATEADFRSATHRLLRTSEHPSSLRLTLTRGVFPPAVTK